MKSFAIHTEGHDMDSSNTSERSYEKTLAARKAEWLEKAFVQIELAEGTLDAMDRAIGLTEGDVLVCETTCLGYAAHALEKGASELWLVPPQLSSGEPSPEMLGAFQAALRESFGNALERLSAHGDAFRGFTTSVPNSAFRMLVTTQHVTDDQAATEWPLYNRYWVDMLNTEGSTGAIIYPPSDEGEGRPWPIIASHVGGTYSTEGFTSATELPGGYVALATGNPAGKTVSLDDFSGLGIDPFQAMLLTVDLHMEDLSDPDDPWTCEATALTLAANGGRLVPSMVRSGIEVVEETTLGEISSRISRGTTLSEKALEVKGRLAERAQEAALAAEREVWGTLTINTPFPSAAFARAERIADDIWASAREDDLYYVDGSCFVDGKVSPAVLGAMPKGQERYIVDSHDGEVLLVTRNAKEPVVYRAIRPTLIGNGVFVIRLSSDINRDYLACWMRGSYAQEWMHNSGKFLTKKVLECLPVPIITEDAMAQTVLHERSIDRKILDLRERIRQLESSDRFSPLTAAIEDGAL